MTSLPGFAPNMKQQGDGGVDGRATLAVRPDDADSRLALAQVKGGKFTVSYLRDFRHVMTREHAAVGCFTTLEPLPPKHRADVKMEGVVHVKGQPFDRLNLWSVGEYFDGRYPPLPVMTDPYSGKTAGAACWRGRAARRPGRPVRRARRGRRRPRRDRLA